VQRRYGRSDRHRAGASWPADVLAIGTPARVGAWSWRHLLAVCAIAAATVAAAGARACAEVAVPTSQASQMDAAFLEGAPAPPEPAAACFIDTGVRWNPDTAPVVVHSEALDPAQSAEDTSSDLHGTRAIMTAFAPPNDWGTVGIWPRGQAVAINALPAGQSGFPFSYYRVAIDRCKNLAAIYPIRVIVLALGASTAPDPAQMSVLSDAVDRAHSAGLNVVAAAGNAGGAVEWPAAYDPVLAVGAADASGTLCTFSSRGAALDVLAPGCPVQEAFGDTGAPALAQGTSSAAVLVGGAVTALRAYAPALSWQQAEQALVSTAHGMNLDVQAAFDAVGLGSVVASGEQSAAQGTVTPAGSSPPAPVPAVPVAPAVRRLTPWPAPSLRWHRRGRRLTVTLQRRPRAAKALVVLAQARVRATVRTLSRRTTRGAVITFTLPREGKVRLTVCYLADRTHRQSTTLRVAIR